MRMPRNMFELLALVKALWLVPAKSCFICTKTVPRAAASPKLCESSGPNMEEQHSHNCVGIEDELAWCRYVSGRRQWFRETAVFAIANPAAVSGIDIDSSTVPNNAAAKVCEPTVESYRKRNKRIHIVGTAHVSSASAELAGDLVKEIKPDGVFVELDTQRVSRAFRRGIVTKPIKLLFFVESNPAGGGSVTLQSATILPRDFQKTTGLLSGFLDKMTLKSRIEQMYKGLEKQGITPGEEFVRAVEEGVHMDSIVILGDRRMDYTLRRIAKALLFNTDLQKLAEADKKITSKMKEKMPELSEWEDQKVLSKEQFQLFVEHVKTKDSTMDFMGELRKAAPELYDALVGERDIFMGRGMDALLSKSLPLDETGGKPLDTIVAVIGLGHIDGVGKELRSLGWTPYAPHQC